MRRTLAALAALAILPVAQAQDKAKGEMTHSGEFRLRDSWMMNSSGNKHSTTNTFTERFRLDLGFKPAEKLSANATLIQAGEFGRDNTNMPNGTDASDVLVVTQAYANWMTSDDFSVKAGRMMYQIGDGTLMSTNEWQQYPTAYEGVLGTYEAEFGRIQAFGFKYEEFGHNPDPDSVSGLAADQEQNAFGLNFDLKTMPEVLKTVNVHILKDSGDWQTGATPATDRTITGAQGKDILRYGLNVGLMFNIVDLKVWYEGFSGKHKFATSDSRNASGSMIQAEVGANLANFMNSRVFVRYHQDSGDSNVGGADDTKDETYDPYFYEKHCSTGCMDLLGWGNLTFIQAGWTGKPSDTTEVGLSYWMFSRTKKGSVAAGAAANSVTPTPGTAGGNLDGGAASYTGDRDKDKLGDEIDLWASHKYDNGLTMMARVSYFNPGSYFTSSTLTDPPTGGGTDKMKEKPMEVFLEGRFTF